MYEKALLRMMPGHLPMRGNRAAGSLRSVHVLGLGHVSCDWDTHENESHVVAIPGVLSKKLRDFVISNAESTRFATLVGV